MSDNAKGVHMLTSKLSRGKPKKPRFLFDMFWLGFSAFFAGYDMAKDHWFFTAIQIACFVAWCVMTYWDCERVEMKVAVSNQLFLDEDTKVLQVPEQVQTMNVRHAE